MIDHVAFIFEKGPPIHVVTLTKNALVENMETGMIETYNVRLF